MSTETLLQIFLMAYIGYGALNLISLPFILKAYQRFMIRFETLKEDLTEAKEDIVFLSREHSRSVMEIKKLKKALKKLQSQTTSHV